MSDGEKEKAGLQDAATILSMHEEPWKRCLGRMMSGEIPDAMNNFYQSEKDNGGSPVDALLATIHFGALMASSLVVMSNDRRMVAEAAAEAFKDALKRYSLIP